MFFMKKVLLFFIFIQVLRDFKRPDGMTDKEIDAVGDGEISNNYHWFLLYL